MAANSTYKNIQDNVLSLISKSDSTTRNRIKNWINLGYHDFVLRELWPFREVADSFVTVAETQEYLLTTDFSDIDASNISAVSIQGASARKLDYISFSRLRRDYPDFDLEGSGLPQYYYIQAGKIGLWPKPDAVYTIAVDYYKVPTELSSDSDEPIMPIAYREALTQYALSLEHDFNTDPDLAQKAMNRYEQIVRLARNNLLAQPTDVGNVVITGPSQSWTGLSEEVR